MSKLRLFADQHIEVYEESIPVRDILHPAAACPPQLCYRVELGDLIITYSPEPGTWHVHLPGHDQAVQPIHTHRYPPDGCRMILVDHDQTGRAVGIQIL